MTMSSSSATRYAYRALTVQAIQFRGTNLAEVVEFLKPEGPWNPQGANAQCPLKVWTQAAGPSPVHAGQWIVRDPVRGLCIEHADVFAALVEQPADKAEKDDKAEKIEKGGKPAGRPKPTAD